MLIKTKQRAFTLIEILVVVSIMGALFLVALPNYSEYKKRAEVTYASKDLRSLLWDMQTKSFAPKNENIDSYQIDLSLNQSEFSGKGFSGNTVEEELKKLVFSQKIHVNEIRADGVAQNSLKVVFSAGKDAGKISFGAPNQGAKIAEIIIKSDLTDSLEQKITINRTFNTVSVERKKQ